MQSLSHSVPLHTEPIYGYQLLHFWGKSKVLPLKIFLPKGV